MSEPAPRVLVLGGCGFIGRHVVKYLVSFNLASVVRVVDKTLPVMSFLSEELKSVFNSKAVEYVQANLANPEHISRAFHSATGEEFEIVINLAGETRFQLPDSHYDQHILNLRRLCAEEASKRNVTKYIEVSSGHIYDSSKPSSEDSSHIKPWTTLAKYHLLAEQEIAKIPNLPYVIVRLPIVYGPGDSSGLMPRILCAAIYQEEEEKLEFLWGDSLRINTIHVQDVAGVIWFLVCCGVDGEVYNAVDDSDLNQGKFNGILEQLFNVKVSCKGSLISGAASFLAPNIMKEINSNHMEAWQDVCQTYRIENTPLTPYIHKELLMDKAVALNGQKLKSLGFTLSCPQITAPILKDAIQYWIDIKKFPNVLKKSS